MICNTRSKEHVFLLLHLVCCLMWLAGCKEFYIRFRNAEGCTTGPGKETQDWTSTNQQSWRSHV